MGTAAPRGSHAAGGGGAEAVPVLGHGTVTAVTAAREGGRQSVWEWVLGALAHKAWSVKLLRVPVSRPVPSAQLQLIISVAQLEASVCQLSVFS